MKQKPKKVRDKFEQLEVGMVGMSAITHGELLYGAKKSNNAEKAEDLVHQLCDYIPPLPLSSKVPEYYAAIRAELERQGKTIGNNDLWIASHCLELGIILVTNNEKEFSRLNELKIENWV